MWTGSNADIFVENALKRAFNLPTKKLASSSSTYIWGYLDRK